MSIKCYDTNGKYWGKFDETRGLFIPSEEVLADCKTKPQTDYTPDCPFCKRYGTEDCLGSGCRHYKTYKGEPQTEDEILREQCRAFIDIVEQTR